MSRPNDVWWNEEVENLAVTQANTSAVLVWALPVPSHKHAVKWHIS